MYKQRYAELERWTRFDAGLPDRTSKSLFWAEGRPEHPSHLAHLHAYTHRGLYVIDVRKAAHSEGFVAFAYYFERSGVGVFVGFEQNRFAAPTLAAMDKCLAHANAEPPYPPLLAWPADCGVGMLPAEMDP